MIEKVLNEARTTELWAAVKDHSLRSKSVTQAEYDALTEEEKNAGLYVVTDANISLKDRGEVYSTEETRIGTWIDGKPIYRISFMWETGSQINADYVRDMSYLHIDSVCKLGGISVDSSFGYVFPIPFVWSNGVLCGLYYNEGGKQLLELHNVDWLSNKKICVHIEYTKTTDPVPTEQAVVLTSQVELPETLSVASPNAALASPVTVTFPSTAVMASASASSASVRFPVAYAYASASSVKLNL